MTYLEASGIRQRQDELQHTAERAARNQPQMRPHEGEESENRSVRNVAVPEPLEEASLQRDIGIAIGRHSMVALPFAPTSIRQRTGFDSSNQKKKPLLRSRRGIIGTAGF